MPPARPKNLSRSSVAQPAFRNSAGVLISSDHWNNAVFLWRLQSKGTHRIRHLTALHWSQTGAICTKDGKTPTSHYGCRSIIYSNHLRFVDGRRGLYDQCIGGLRLSVHHLRRSLFSLICSDALGHRSTSSTTFDHLPIHWHQKAHLVHY